MKMKFIGTQAGGYPEFLMSGEEYECYVLVSPCYTHVYVVVSPLDGRAYPVNENAFTEVDTFFDVLRATAEEEYDKECDKANDILARAREKRRNALNLIAQRERESRE